MKTKLIIICVLLTQVVFAQKVITGKITDKRNHSLAGVVLTVVDVDSVIKAKTDTAGNYAIFVPDGSVILRIEKDGYYTQEVAISKDVVNVSLYSMAKDIEPLVQTLKAVKVISASRQLTSLDKSPSAITVITATQIQQRGYKTLEEVLQTVPGFFTGHAVAQALIMNRGVTQDQNVNYLLLIDGHAQNSISIYGMDQQHLYPFLGDVKQIEIIRGPGSTMWGSDALMGIINIITKDAEDVDNGKHKVGGISAFLDEQIRDHQTTGNIQYAKKFGEKTNLIVSYSATKSNGDIQPILSQAFVTNAKEPVARANGESVDAYRRIPLSQEVYLKSKIHDFTIKGRFSNQKGISGFATVPSGLYEQSRLWQQGFFETSYDKKLSEYWKIEAKAFYDKIYMEYKTEDNPNTESTLKINNDETDKQIGADDQGIGSEIISNYTRKHINLLFGVRSMYWDAKPSIVTYPAKPQIYKYHTGGTDFTNAIFTEANYSGIKNFIFVAGLRFDKNDFRDTRYFLLPRAAVIYMLKEKLTFKYMLNTGVMRPTLTYRRFDEVTLSNGKPATLKYGTDKSQQSISNDIQVIYTSKKMRITNTLFYTVLNNFTTTAIGKYQYASLSPLTTKGVELEFDANPIKILTIYGNISYCYAKYKDTTIYSSYSPTPIALDPNTANLNYIMTDDKEALGPPRLLWNLGVDVNLPKLFTICLHYRGWSEEKVRWGSGGSEGIKKIGPEHYLDVNLIRNSFFVKNLDLTIYVKNIFDNQDYIIGLPRQLTKYYGRAFGASLSFKF